MKKYLTAFLLFQLLLGITGCDRPKCDNSNPIFESNTPDSKLYKDELVRQLTIIDDQELTYWLQKYEDRNGEESLYFNIQGDGLCAILHLTVKNWNKLEDVRDRNGVGRRGAEFTNLEFEINQDSTTTQFIYQTYDRLID
ncbi:hypothetical protein N8371_06200 [Vicingaceae bacterium]|nr:hypothetical protein [Vicingaceae bacterium]MDB4060706.1 hypothetical protein [Vicingaceae bacterium]MDC1451982.1 hypothetical protein [Vicingaceae bacterium]